MSASSGGRPLRWSAFAGLGALAVACADPAATTAGSAQVDVSLDGRWSDGVVALPRAGAGPPFHVSRPITLPASWVQGNHAVLRARGYGWRVRVSIDGVEVGRDVGGLRPLAIDLSQVLHAGRQGLALSVEAPDVQTVWPGYQPPSVLPFTYAQPRVGAVVAQGELWLELAPGPRVDAVQVRARGETLEVEATAAGAEGQPVTFEVVRDGRVLARLPDGVVRDGVARSSGAWTRQRWTVGSGAAPQLQYLVARLPDGGARQVRFGARDIVREGRRLRLDGEPLYLTAERVPVNLEPRTQLASLLQSWVAIGYNAVEVHGLPVPGRFLDAADELGLPVVRTPMCDGRRREEGDFPPTYAWAEYVGELSRRVAADEAHHPSVAFWSVEAHSLPAAPTLYTPFLTGSTPGVDLAEASGYNSETFGQRPPRGKLAPFIIELAFRMEGSGRTAAIVSSILEEHGADGMGTVLPDLLPEDLSRATARERTYLEAIRPALAAATQPALTSGSRRGIATVHATLRRAGAPVDGAVLVLDAPGHASIGALTDARGLATFELDYEGPATVHELGGAQSWPVELVPGRYEGGRWVPAPVAAELTAE